MSTRKGRKGKRGTKEQGNIFQMSRKTKAVHLTASFGAAYDRNNTTI